ncbi:MAG: HIT family protein [Sulfobacillus thermosulfidooxidans]|uniref:HIT family protein n=1 Tax=Sulfobacillus thermotolerans TaxID=338644 RepID=A0ABM6RUH3_9FIRM|nr:HIT family protein [Sulfobacillus sp. hq2]AUW95022.1 HIT family protein [Sulfobacillus thermotolerans]POB10378.1 HIT family protein [Sulfobacillus sp. hq2]PSR37900.1 MAG: HIT family protein [Sulfobacillus thermosulfidooxidans]
MPSIFSQIIAGELPSVKVRENDEFLAFLDIRPVTPGHTLIVPKKEVDYFFDMEDPLLEHIWLFAKPLAQALKRVTGCERVAAVVAGFDVPHAHLHLIPASDMSDLNFAHATPSTPAELAEMGERIRQALSA